ncbi:DUF624 domain-containing protein [Bacillaceae bacterium Marseille-Q3522]|nr:DUF624 domain-containing protein [Bacillaceae bacterium Marseille-Q3522]
MNWVNVSNKLIQWVFIVMKLTGIWWLFNFPYVILGLLLMRAPTVANVNTIFIVCIVLFPIIIVPATVATLAITRRYGRDDDNFSFVKVFWKYYKTEYVRSLTLGCLNIIVLILFYIALRYYSGQSSLLAMIFYILVILTPFFFLYVYSFLVDQELPVRTYLTNTIYLLLMHPINTSLMILDVIGLAVILWFAFPPLLLFVLPGLLALIVTHFFQKGIKVETLKSHVNS